MKEVLAELLAVDAVAGLDPVQVGLDLDLGARLPVLRRAGTGPGCRRTSCQVPVWAGEEVTWRFFSNSFLSLTGTSKVSTTGIPMPTLLSWQRVDGREGLLVQAEVVGREAAGRGASTARPRSCRSWSACTSPPARAARRRSRWRRSLLRPPRTVPLSRLAVPVGVAVGELDLGQRAGLGRDLDQRVHGDLASPCPRRWRSGPPGPAGGWSRRARGLARCGGGRAGRRRAAGRCLRSGGLRSLPQAVTRSVSAQQIPAAAVSARPILVGMMCPSGQASATRSSSSPCHRVRLTS